MIAYGNMYSAGTLDPTDPQSGYDLFYDVGPGSGSGKRTNTAMGGDYIRIVSPPTATSSGVAYMFHDTGTTVYYLSVLLASDKQVEDMLKGIQISGDIIGPTTVDSSTTSVNATLDFTASSDAGITSYSLSNVSSNATVNESLSGAVSGSPTVYNKSVPITISIPGTSADVSIDVTCTDSSGNSATITVTHNIQKVVAGAAVTGSFDANASAVLRADNRGSEQFDISSGIPTTEDLYANVTANGYVVEEDYLEVTGVRNYTVNVSRSYDYEWWDSTDRRHHTYDAMGTIVDVTGMEDGIEILMIHQ